MGAVVVTGAGGLLGREVTRVWRARGRDVRPLARADLDVTDAEAVAATISGLAPEIVVHCAAMTDVDACESTPERAFGVNAEGAANVARATSAAGAALVAISTDYVFDGRKGSPYVESDPTNPIQRYGASKLAGEELVREHCPDHYVVRSAWIYGVGGKNFLSKLPEMGRSQGTVRAVADQLGSPTYAPDLAEALLALCGSGAHGTYHVTNGGACTFVEFCRQALPALGARDVEVEEIRLDDLDRPAPRPADTRLASTNWPAAGLEPLRPWQEAAAAFCLAAPSEHGRAAAPSDPLR